MATRKRWYKGELHFHCEGSTMPEMLVTYRRRRYDFCVSTEHDAVHQVGPYVGSDNHCHTDLASAALDRPLLLIAGSEMSLTIPRQSSSGVAKNMPVHVGAFPLRLPVEKHSAIGPTLVKLSQRTDRPVIVINHPLAGGPERHWSVVDVIEAIAQGATHFELNPRNYGIELGLRLWDEVLSQGYRIYGILTNDAHETANIGRYGATLVQASALTTEALMHGLRRGSCYALESGCQARLIHLALEGKTIEVNVKQAEELHFIGAEGRILHLVYAEAGKYRIPPDERYVRIEAVDNSGRRLFSQPVWPDA